MAASQNRSAIDALTRLDALVSALQSGPITLVALAKRLKITTRTVQRDLAVLRDDLGAPVELDIDGYTRRLSRR